MSRHSLAGGSVLLLLVATLAFCGDPEPDRLKKAADDWWGKIAAIQKDRDKKLAALFKEMRATEAELNALLKPARAASLQGENQFKAAATQFEGSLKDLASKPKLLGMTLIQLGGLYATMGDYDKARSTVLRGWRTLKAYSATAPRDFWPLIDGSAAAGVFLLQIERPYEAAFCINLGLSLCEKPGQGISLKGTLLHAHCLLAKAVLANALGDHQTARGCSKLALDQVKRFYPPPAPPHRYPMTLESAAALSYLAVAKLHLEEEPEAFELLREAQMIVEKLIPKGHLILAEVYSYLAELYLQRGQEVEALKCIEQSYDTYSRLFPKEQYPKSHPGLIQAMTSLGNILDRTGHDKPALREAALKMHKRAWEECRKYYTSPHASKIDVLLGYGRSLRSAGRIADAEQQFQDALKIAHELYPKWRYPRGYPIVARCLLHLGGIQRRQGRYRAARQTLEQAQAMFRAYYRPDHPELSTLSQDLGTLALRTNDRKGARDAFAQALTRDQRQIRRYARIASEAEAIAFAQQRRKSFDGYLSVSREGGDDADSYALVWTAKSAITRVLRERLALLHAAGAKSPSPLARQRARELRDLSALISHVLLNDRPDDPTPRKQLAELMEKEERLRRELDKDVAVFHRSVEMDRETPAELAKRLPEQSVFVDFVRYEDSLEDEKARSRYVAFVLAPGGVPQRVELGFAEPIQRAVKGWRKAVESLDPLAPAEARHRAGELADKHAAELRRLVWEPIAKRFPTTGTNRVYLSPDGHLSCIPFAALPGETEDSILLEKYTIAYVPHGPFLLERLRHPTSEARDRGRFLTLGNLAFDAHRQLRARVETSQAAAPSALTPIRLGGVQATPGKLCEMLQQARFADLATHGFFKKKLLDAEHKRLQQYLREWRFDAGQPVSGVGLGGRSPLSYTGLVLANGTVLTGSTISALSLEGLYLVVLSACETGLGEYTAGEGVQALQRAFHLAGCPNVIASLWKVDDAATNVLMAEFYHKLWGQNLEPLEALRKAQLE
ncbi:MAG: CHAT domain-containing protein, partial [Gemmataceae bacterium]